MPLDTRTRTYPATGYTSKRQILSVSRYFSVLLRFSWPSLLFLLAIPTLIFSLASFTSLPYPTVIIATVLSWITFAFVAMRSYTSIGWYSPIFLLIPLASIRYHLPYAITTLSPHPFVLYDLLRIDNDSAVRGLLLVDISMLAASISAWSIIARSRTLSCFRAVSDGHRAFVIGILFFAVGTLSWTYYVTANAGSLAEPLLSGSFRGFEIREGTGWAWYGSLLLITGSALLCYSQAARGKSFLRSLLPGLAASALFFVLGGRSRAFSPLIISLIILTVAGRVRANRVAAWRRRARARILVAALVLGIFVLVSGRIYREGEHGLVALTRAESWQSALESWSYMLVIDAGQLHGPAAAATQTAGDLGLQPLVSNFLGPLAQFLPLAGKSAGVYVVQQSMGFVGRKWGIHVGLAGEGYLYMGLLGTLGLGLSWGVAAGYLTCGLARGSVHPVVFSILSWYIVRIFFEGTEKFGEMLVVVAPAIAMTFFSTRPRIEVKASVAQSV